jgi:hypothetical protein
MRAAVPCPTVRSEAWPQKRRKGRKIGQVKISTFRRNSNRIDELPVIFAEATGVDIREVMDKWLRPLER